ncbi:MAG: glycoside hydrolase family 10 protein [Gemmatimonadales bacterium]
MNFRRSAGAAAVALCSLAGAPPHARQLLPRSSIAPPTIAREFRAAWVTPMPDRGFRDWPSAPGLSADSQKTELRSLLDRAAALGLNAIILHVRLASDALYPSNYAPWSAALSGRPGGDPGYDPLAYAVSEAHSRGLQLHAWFNPFRALLPGGPSPQAASHVTRRHPEWIRKYGAQTWIDPGEPAARAFVLQTILDVVKRYDIDGVHIDDYFYPYRETRTIVRRVHRRRVVTHREISFPDDRTWRKYGAAKGWKNRDDWRRNNIDSFVKSLYDSVKQLKPSVVVGVSPFGIWRPGSPRGITGLDSYDEIYADSRKWLAEAWLDYVAPQLYWEVGGIEDRFRVLDAWWRSQNPHGRFVWPGLYSSHVYNEPDRWPVDAIAAQIASIRDARIGSTDPPGHVHFRLSALIGGDGRLAASVGAMYREPALVPAFPWLGAAVPAAPLVAAAGTDGSAALSVAPGDSVHVRWWLIQTLGRDSTWTTTLRPADDRPLAASSLGPRDALQIAITAISPTGIASAPALLTP